MRTWGPQCWGCWSTGWGWPDWRWSGTVCCGHSGCCHLQGRRVNSLAPGKLERIFRHVIFKQILAIDSWGISCEIALIWMSLDFTDDQSILVQVIAWCRQATSHYLSQCWPRSLSPYGDTRPQWVNPVCDELFGGKHKNVIMYTKSYIFYYFWTLRYKSLIIRRVNNPSGDEIRIFWAN